MASIRARKKLFAGNNQKQSELTRNKGNKKDKTMTHNFAYNSGSQCQKNGAKGPIRTGATSAAKVELRALEEKNQMIISGYATTFNDPYLINSNDIVYEVIDPNAFRGCDMSDVIMQFDHAGHVLARTTNGTLKLTVDQKGLYCEARLDGTEEGRKVFEEVKGAYLSKMSFRFTVAEGGERRERKTFSDGTPYILRTILRFKKIWDVSVVTLPANPGTSVNARKAHSQEELRRLKQKIKILAECGRRK